MRNKKYVLCIEFVRQEEESVSRGYKEGAVKERACIVQRINTQNGRQTKTIEGTCARITKIAHALPIALAIISHGSALDTGEVRSDSSIHQNFGTSV